MLESFEGIFGGRRTWNVAIVGR